MLEYINLFLIMILIMVIIIDSVYLAKSRDDIRALTNKVEKKERESSRTSLLDLAEFDKLDPTFKTHYKTYVVNGVMPEMMDVTNNYIKTYKVNEEITKNDAAIRQGIREMAQAMRDDFATSLV